MNPTEIYMSRPELVTSQGPNPVETSKLPPRVVSIFSNYAKKATEVFLVCDFHVWTIEISLPLSFPPYNITYLKESGAVLVGMQFSSAGFTCSAHFSFSQQSYHA